MIDSIREAYRLARNGRPDGLSVEITESVYDEAMGAVPPIYKTGGGFWVGEPYTHDAHGREISLECWHDNGRFFCRLSPVERPDYMGRSSEVLFGSYERMQDQYGPREAQW